MGETGRVGDETETQAETRTEASAGVSAGQIAEGFDAELAVIRKRAEAVRDEQVERALTRLGGSGEVSARQRAAVERLADRLVEQLLAVPAASLDAIDEEDAATREAVLDLFGGDRS